MALLFTKRVSSFSLLGCKLGSADEDACSLSLIRAYLVLCHACLTRKKPTFEALTCCCCFFFKVEAANYDLNYIGLNGNIGCMGKWQCQAVLTLP